MASQVRVNTLEHVPTVVVLSKFTVAPLQASDAVGGVKFGLAVHSIVPFNPALPIVGGVLSLTVIVCETVPLWFKHASTAFHILVSV